MPHVYVVKRYELTFHQPTLDTIADYSRREVAGIFFSKGDAKKAVKKAEPDRPLIKKLIEYTIEKVKEGELIPVPECYHRENLS